MTKLRLSKCFFKHKCLNLVTFAVIVLNILFLQHKKVKPGKRDEKVFIFSSYEPDGASILRR